MHMLEVLCAQNDVCGAFMYLMANSLCPVTLPHPHLLYKFSGMLSGLFTMQI